MRARNERGSQAGKLAPIARELNPEAYRPADSERHPRTIAADPFTSAEPVRQYERGRICAAPECEAKLSIYNSSPFCALHPATKMLVVTSEVPKKIGKKSKNPPKRRRRST